MDMEASPAEPTQQLKHQGKARFGPDWNDEVGHHKNPEKRQSWLPVRKSNAQCCRACTEMTEKQNCRKTFVGSSCSLH